MSDSGNEPLPLDEAFDAAFDHLSACRIEYEDDPRDPERIERLGAARIGLEDARVAMNDERVRLGLEERAVHLPPMPKFDSDAKGSWQGIHPN